MRRNFPALPPRRRSGRCGRPSAAPADRAAQLEIGLTSRRRLVPPARRTLCRLVVSSPGLPPDDLRLRGPAKSWPQLRGAIASIHRSFTGNHAEKRPLPRGWTLLATGASPSSDRRHDNAARPKPLGQSRSDKKMPDLAAGHSSKSNRDRPDPWAGRIPRPQRASGSGRIWNWTTRGWVPLPVSMWNGVRLPLVVYSARPFQPPFGSSMRPSIHLAKKPIG